MCRMHGWTTFAAAIATLQRLSPYLFECCQGSEVVRVVRIHRLLLMQPPATSFAFASFLFAHFHLADVNRSSWEWGVHCGHCVLLADGWDRFLIFVWHSLALPWFSYSRRWHGLRASLPPPRTPLVPSAPSGPSAAGPDRRRPHPAVFSRNLLHKGGLFFAGPAATADISTGQMVALQLRNCNGRLFSRWGVLSSDRDGRLPVGASRERQCSSLREGVLAPIEW